MAGYHVCLLTLFASFAIARISADGLGRGFGDNIDWQTLDKGLEIAKENNKPLMLIIHKSWCGACKALKPKFAASKEIEKLSESFVMVNVEDAEEPSDTQFSPDGGYIPRILFLSPEGKVEEQIINKIGNAKYKYYYPEASQVLTSMKNVVAFFGRSNDEL